MKKKKTINQSQRLSPENYIRERSKTLPLYKCFINDEWEECNICNIFITRQHVTGNVTVCMYLVDLNCLGVKDTSYEFNIPFREVEKMHHRTNDVKFVEVPYKLVHNIIYAGIEFAEKYDFKPCKDFISITQHFLEDDTDAIPLMKIECGENGKPCYTNTGYDTPARARQIIAQLERTAGEGNYDYITLVDENSNFYDDFDDFDEDEEDDFDEDDFIEEINEELVEEILTLSKEEQINRFIDYYKKEEGEELSDKELQLYIALTNFLSFDLATVDAIGNQLDIWKKKFDYPFVDETELPNSLFMDIHDTDVEKLSDLFFDTFNDCDEPKKVKKSLENFHKEIGDSPAYAYLEFVYLLNSKKKKFAKELAEYCRKYPDYFLLQLYQHIYNQKDELINFEKLLSQQKLPITKFEIEIFFSFYVIYFVTKDSTDIAAVLALELFLNQLDFIEDDTRIRNMTIFHEFKTKMLVEHFEKIGLRSKLCLKTSYPK